MKKLDRFAAAWRAACQGGSPISSAECQAKASRLRAAASLKTSGRPERVVQDERERQLV